MVVVDALHGNSAAAAADDLFGVGTSYADLQAFFDHKVPEEKASACASDGEEELEWLSNKDAFPTVETMDSAAARPRTKGVRQSRPVAAAAAAERRQCRHCGIESTPQWRDGPAGRRTLCNACGIRYRTGRLLPEYRPAKSPTFSSALHSNRHHRIVELRRCREEAAGVCTSLAAAGYGKEGGQDLARLSNKSVFLAPAEQRPRTKGLQRPRKVPAWSPPPPPRTPAPAGWWRSGVGEAGLAIQQGRVPSGGDSGGGAEEGRAAATVGVGVEATAPRALAVAGPRRRKGGRDGMAVEQRRVPGSGDDAAAADDGRAAGRRLNQPGGGEMALDQGIVVPFVGSSCTRGGGEGVDHAAVQAPASAVARRWCQHCGTENTPQWRRGPGGRRTLCNACGQRYNKSCRLVPLCQSTQAGEQSPTLCPTLHSPVVTPANGRRR